MLIVHCVPFHATSVQRVKDKVEKTKSIKEQRPKRGLWKALIKLFCSLKLLAAKDKVNSNG
jgi:hypothetical protein